MKAIFLHENDQWMPPYRRELVRSGVPYEEWLLRGGHFDLHLPPPEGVYVNRMSPSAHTRGHRSSVPYTRELLVWLESHGRRVINGSSAFGMEISKVRQCAALRAAGIDTPRTLSVAGAGEHLKEAARRMPLPFIAKHNRGGSGASVRKFDSLDEFERYVDSDEYEVSVDHVTLLQEYVQAPQPFITRVEIVDGEFLFAMRVDTSQGFDLCPADPCRDTNTANLCPLQAAAGRFTIREDIDSALIDRYLAFLQANRIDVAGIEFIEDADGRPITYDVNGTTNYSENLTHRHGINGAGSVVRMVARLLDEERDEPVAVVGVGGKGIEGSRDQGI